MSDLECTVCAPGVTSPHGVPAAPGHAGPLHFTYDGAMALQCFADNPEAEFGETVAFVGPGDSLDFLTGKVREHQAAHGCAAQEPHAAPGSLRADLEATVKTWREESEPYPEEDAADSARRSGFGYCAGELAQILAQHAAAAAQPAPELAAAMRETRDVRDGYAKLCGEFSDSPQSGQSARISLTVLNRHRAAAGLPALRPAPAGERRDPYMKLAGERDQLRELLDEIGVMAANAPEDGDSFALLEEIAMRIGAAEVPPS